VRQWVIVELILRNVQVSRVGVLVTLVGVELVEWLLLVVLSPSPIRGVNTTINACGI